MTAEDRKTDRASARSSGRENGASGIQIYPFLFRVPPKTTPYCPGKGSITTKEAVLRDQLDPPKQAASCLLNCSATDKTASVSALHFRPLNSLQPRTSSSQLCGQLLFPLCGAFASSAVGLFISLHSLSSLPDTCILQAAGVLSKPEQWEALNRAQARPQSIFTSV